MSEAGGTTARRRFYRVAVAPFEVDRRRFAACKRTTTAPVPPMPTDTPSTSLRFQ
ncbi:hypothetical protein [Streptomyces stelliscabiei]|uniref:hypothetical protein n=1 Tax=Streptomyces stelliscabiei TaxID=146820 RepID=UPI0029ACBA76|nr:hypothetical protein [Streptomyces stelliscabiei]MDX2556211.1 hypothetical protein [Streptomyces stelliscabiei]MDX2610414.1 hypothetical protein [Streptomyces stelliscabiei]MDX2639988.1 hypothetical protein [Streptomyces stelliscabiei]MDX2665216.1 hypothetical protein [Streptomyces stelliscabiei]MDX2715318.1 hypothetical protein [Streptomyces stelliscabiei]